MNKLLILLTALLVLGGSCKSVADKPRDTHMAYVHDLDLVWDGHVREIVDVEHGVRCYLVQGTVGDQAVSISCVREPQ